MPLNLSRCMCTILIVCMVTISDLRRCTEHYLNLISIDQFLVFVVGLVQTDHSLCLKRMHFIGFI